MVKLFYIFLLGYIFDIVVANNKSIFYFKNDEVPYNEYEEWDKSSRYCLRFTWLGDKYDKQSFHKVKNKTCSEHFEKNSILCVDPMAVTFTGKKPDIDYVLDNYRSIASCKLLQGQVCAKYTIYYNGIASHIVRYCTRIDIESEGPMVSGCLTQRNGSYSYEVCACVSDIGAKMMCNSGVTFNVLVIPIFLCIAILIIAERI